MGSTANSRKEKNQNIQVFVRLRPLNNRERDLKSIGIVEVSGVRDVVVKQPLSDNKFTKKFSFDKVFGPSSKQVDVYQDVVSPLIDEVLAGYNCTVFAYGQTGTGKTHTMVGESSGQPDTTWKNDPMAGIVPRSLSQLFDELRITNSEYTVRVSYLELYNEELFDLLSSSEDNSKLRIYEDVTRKGSNIVSGLEEVTVYNKNEVYKIMSSGQERRRVASTLMNSQSSRSHTIFTIVVHMKESNPDGEELVKVGKLNLVDLAGSENISKAGNDNPTRRERARECVNINQSLLTLGRVITALVERHPHIPYRESKLTRLLQESLGGRTKTSIIATISPGHKDIEETLSTLEYAHRARNIQNKPEINQKMTTKAVLKEFSEEIDKLKRDLQASRDRNGVYLSNETYAELTLKVEEQEKEVQEQILLIKAMNEEKERMEKIFTEMSKSLENTKIELDITNQTLDHTKNVLNDKEKELKQAGVEIEEQKYIVSKQVETEKILSDQAKDLLHVADSTTSDINLLQNAIEKKRLLETNNVNAIKSFENKSQSVRDELKNSINSFADSLIENFMSYHNDIEKQNNIYVKNQTQSKNLMDDLFNQIKEAILVSDVTKNKCVESVRNSTNENFDRIKQDIESQYSNVSQKFNILLGTLIQLSDIREKERQNTNIMANVLKSWKDSATAKMLNLKYLQKTLWESIDSSLKEIEQKNRTNYENNLHSFQKLSKSQKEHDEDLSKYLCSLKTIITEMEDKHLKHTNERYIVEEESLTASMSNHNDFSASLKTANCELSSKMGDVDSIIDVLEETNKIFIQDMTNTVNNCLEDVNNGTVIDNMLKESTTEVLNSNNAYFNNCLRNTESTMKELNEIHETVIVDQQKSYNNFLGECEKKHENIVQPLHSTIELIQNQIIQNQKELDSIQKQLSNYKEKLHSDLLINEKIEYKLINEDYKLYSPTGKTPIRRDYRYPIQLASTSPHERILTRFRNTKNSSTCDNSIIELDNTMDSTSLKNTSGNAQNDGDDTSKIVLNDSIFVEPKPVNFSPENNQNNSLLSNSSHKSISENDIYKIMDEKQCKENLNTSASDKKESRLKQPQPIKRVLSNKN